NAAWAERAVRESVSLSAPEAVRMDVVDKIASGPSAALHAAGFERFTVRRDGIPFGRGLIGTLVDPNLAFLLFIVGLGGILFEVLHPGLSVPGVVGFLALQ